MEAAEILVHTKRNPLDGSVVVCGYSWVGSPYAQVSLERRLWEDRDRMPWQLESIFSDNFESRVIAVRVDVPVPFYAYHRFERDVLAIVSALLWCRALLILTAMVWGFAYVPQGVFPSWEHLFQRRPY